MPNTPQSEEAAKIKAARPELNGQELKTLIYQGIELPNYKIASDGLIISYARVKDGKPLSWVGKGTVRFKYPAVNLALPADKLLYVNTEAGNYNKKTHTVGRTVSVHILVSDAWLGIDSCPKELKPWWHIFPLEAKKVMRRYFSVDHIDDNKLNPHVSNLKFVSPRENNWITKSSLLAQGK